MVTESLRKLQKKRNREGQEETQGRKHADISMNQI